MFSSLINIDIGGKYQELILVLSSISLVLESPVGLMGDKEESRVPEGFSKRVVENINERSCVNQKALCWVYREKHGVARPSMLCLCASVEDVLRVLCMSRENLATSVAMSQLLHSLLGEKTIHADLLDEDLRTSSEVKPPNSLPSFVPVASESTQSHFLLRYSHYCET